MVILLNKPFRVLCQFTDSEGRATLADFVSQPGVYPAGRLDYDSEGLVVLTDEAGLQSRISHPRHRVAKTYWAQVEGVPDQDALRRLRAGIEIGGRRTKQAGARIITEPERLWPREPPIRYRASVPTSWLEITLKEGKNRQVRRMTAAVGHPTLRLVRASIGQWELDRLAPGEWREVRSRPM